jgi:hypothetical protein
MFFHVVLFAEDDIVREFVGVCAPIVWEIGFERVADLGNDGGDPTGVVGLIEMGEDVPDLLVPEFLAYFLVDALVAEDGQLPIFQGDVDENAVAGGGALHVQPGKDLGGPVERGDVTAAAFHKDADLAAGAFFGGLDSLDDYLLLSFVEERLSFEEGKGHGK